MGVKLWDYCLNDIGPTTPMVRYPVPMDMHTLVLNLMQVYRDDNHTFDDWSGYIEAITGAVELTAYDTIKHHRGWPKQVPNYDMVVPYDFITEDYINELARGIALYTGGDKPAKGMWYAG